MLSWKSIKNSLFSPRYCQPQGTAAKFRIVDCWPLNQGFVLPHVLAPAGSAALSWELLPDSACGKTSDKPFPKDRGSVTSPVTHLGWLGAPAQQGLRAGFEEMFVLF